MSSISLAQHIEAMTGAIADLEAEQADRLLRLNRLRQERSILLNAQAVLTGEYVTPAYTTKGSIKKTYIQTCIDLATQQPDKRIRLTDVVGHLVQSGRTRHEKRRDVYNMLGVMLKRDDRWERVATGTFEYTPAGGDK